MSCPGAGGMRGGAGDSDPPSRDTGISRFRRGAFPRGPLASPTRTAQRGGPPRQLLARLVWADEPVSGRKEGACRAPGFSGFVKGFPPGRVSSGGGCFPSPCGHPQVIYAWTGPRETQRLRSHYREVGGGRGSQTGCGDKDKDGRVTWERLGGRRGQWNPQACGL